MTLKKFTTAGLVALGALAVGLALADGAFAQAAAPAAAAAPPAPKLDTGDTAWMLTSTALVLMMTIPGLGLFYGGMVRKKNVLATVMQSFAITCLVTVLWMILGYSMAFTEGSMNAYIGSFSKLFLAGVGAETTNSLAATIPETVFITFQMTFAIITPALIAGAFAERMKFSAMMWFMGLWLIFVYCPIAHWVWGGGFLGSAGVLDFAGGTVVHINAGVAGLVCALILGKRKGYGTVSMAPYNLVYAFIGASLLWVGWFGFNAGSAAASNALAGAAMINTQVATAAAALAWMFAEWIIAKKPSVLGIVSGAVAGLVAVTPASGFVNPTGALIIGLLAGVGCYIAAVHVKKALGYDDSLDAFGVHGVGGIIGAILTGVFADAAVNPLGKDASVGTQIYGVAVTIIYTAIVTAIILYIVKAVIGLRPTEQGEEEGLDITLHGETVQ
ncbi:ammonium transporter [Pseudolabrys taiwanensis]|uniref:Ammonium transporter n=2 Tax=Pseudolabrys taiwanensis TaxID=331696 RepID=A0A345ZZW3_9HYPH|nr:ammonium transporter [Pseudolabrys taiwanensis]AXK82460.1 ammonium transporter [Pseudolabrys taiwanensis]